MLPELSSNTWDVRLSHRAMFVGREDELAQLERLLSVPRTLLTVYGTPGVGKTSLCAHWAKHSALPVLLFPHGALNSAQSLWQALGEVLDLRQQDTPTATTTQEIQDDLVKVLAHRPTCVLWFDGAVANEDVQAILVKWLRKAPHHRILLTGHRRIQIPGEHGLELGGLKMPHALALFEACAKEVSVEFKLDETSTPPVRTIIEQLNGNPLGIEIVASQLLLYDLDQLVARLADSMLDMQNVWQNQSNTQHSLRAALLPVWNELEPRARLLMFAVSFWHLGVTLKDLGDVFPDMQTSDLFRAALALRSRALLERVNTPNGERFKLNGMVQQLAREQMQHALADAEIARIERACVQCMLDLTRDALEHTRKTFYAASRARLEHHLRQLAPYLEHAELSVEALIVTQRARRILSVLAPQSNTIHQALRRQDTTHLDNDNALAIRLEILWLDRQRGTLKIEQVEALYDAALNIQSTQLAGEIARLHTESLKHSGGSHRAIDPALRALEHFQDVDDEAGIAYMLYVIVFHHLDLIMSGEQVDRAALHHYMSAQEVISMKLGDYYRELYESNRAAYAFLAGEHQRAFDIAREGISRSEADGEPLMTLMWTQYFHSCISRQCVDEALVIDTGNRLIEQCIQQARPIGVTIVVHAMSLLAFGQVQACRTLLETYDALLQEEAKPTNVTGTLETLRAANALVEGDTLVARDHIARATEAFNIVSPTSNSFVLAMFTGLADVIDLEMPAAHQQFTRAAEVIDLIGQLKREKRETALKLCSSVQTRNPIIIQTHLAQTEGDTARLVQVIRTIVQGVLQHLNVSNDASHVDFYMAHDGSWFQAPGSASIDIRKRLAHTRILAALIDLYKSSPGEVLNMYDLIEIGWPEESLDLDAGTNRVRATIYALRSLGLRDVLVNEQGYLLAPNAVIITQDTPPQSS